MYETDTLSHLTHWTECEQQAAVCPFRFGCIQFSLAQPHDSPLPLFRPDNKAKMGREAAHYPSLSCDPADWIFFEEYNSGNSPLIGFLTHIWLIFLCRANFSCLCRSISSLETRKAEAFKYTNVGCLESVRLPSFTHTMPIRRGLCSPSRKSLFFPLTVWLAEWKSANIRFDLAVRVFVVLIAKYVAIYALRYIMSAMYLCCCIRENTFQDTVRQKRESTETACVVDGRKIQINFLCLWGRLHSGGGC